MSEFFVVLLSHIDILSHNYVTNSSIYYPALPLFLGQFFSYLASLFLAIRKCTV